MADYKRKRKPLEPWQLEDAQRLRAIFARVSTEDQDLTQATLGELTEIGSQGNVSHYLAGRIPLTLEKAIAFADALGVSITEISPRLGALAQKGGSLSVVAPTKRKTIARSMPKRSRHATKKQA